MPCFRYPRRAAELIELRERGVEIGLLEKLPAVDRVAVDRGNVDCAPVALKALARGPMRDMSDNSSKVVQPMHSLDVGADVLIEVQPGTDVCGQVTGCERRHAAVVDAHAVRRGLRQLVPADRSVGPCDDRPCVGVVGRFAGEVPGVEFRDGGFEVVGVKGDERRDPVVGVDLGDIEDIGAERIGPLVAARSA